MTVRTAICALVIMTATAFGQDPMVVINTTRSQVRSGTNAVDQRRNDTIEQATPGANDAQPDTSAPQARQSGTNMTLGFPSTKGTGSSAAPEMKKSTTGRGKRDPFVSVIRTQTLEMPACPTGKRCLVVGQIALKGIVRSGSGMIAVVENPERKTYFLHENDPVFNGQVVKIESDGIIFREKVVDRLGRQSMREVVKRLGKPAA